MTMGRAVALLRSLALSGSLLLALGGCAAAPSVVALASSPPAVSSPAATVSEPAPSVPPVPTRDATILTAAGPIAPTELRIGAIDLGMVVAAVGVTDDSLMELPPDTAVAGWYRFGPGVSEAAGTTVIAAHVDSNAYGLGPFARLKDLAPGESIELTTADGTVAPYTVSTVNTVVKAEVPLADVFSRDGPPRLVLITCGGDFDYTSRHYLSNVIVEATPA